MSSKDPCLHNKHGKIQPMHNFTVTAAQCKLLLQLQFTTATVELCIYGDVSLY